MIVAGNKVWTGLPLEPAFAGCGGEPQRRSVYADPGARHRMPRSSRGCNAGARSGARVGIPPTPTPGFGTSPAQYATAGAGFVAFGCPQGFH